ncbi:MCE family protein [Mycolicibacterium pulveris]|uniref:MCE family protein n=1 Tax=Mycolicibacterium pulveris TaxID=36813 RepID=UPI003CF444BB
MKYRGALIGFASFLVVALVLTILVYGTLRRDPDGPTDRYSALFTDVTGLRGGDDVRVAGVRVGRVDAVILNGDVAQVTFQIDSGQSIYPDTIASVMYQNIVGQRYLALSRDRSNDPAPRLPPGSQIPLERTEPSFDIGALLNGFEPLFTLLDSTQVDRLTTAMIDAFQGDSVDVAHFVAQTAELTATFAGPDELLGDLIDNLDTVVGDLATQDANLDGVITSAHTMVSELNHRRDNLIASAGSLNRTAGRIAAIGEAVYPQMSELLHREPGFVQHVAGMPDQLAFLGSNTPLLLKGLARMSGDGAYGNAYGCSVNLMGFFPGLTELVPKIVELASPGNDVKYSQKCRPTQ